MDNIIFHSALKFLDERQRRTGLVTLRKIEDDEISRMDFDPSYISPLNFLREPLYREIAKRIPPLQSIIQFKILGDHKIQFEKLIKNSFSNPERYLASQNLYFGTLISNPPDFNASMAQIGDEYLIIFNENLLEALRYISDIFSTPLVFKNNDHGFDIDYKIAENNVQRFRCVIQRFVESQHHLYGIDIKPDPAKSELWQKLWAILHESMESFAFGHEYGHFIKRHFKRNIIAQDWSQEYEADRIGIDLVAMSIIQEQRNSGNIIILLTLCGCYLLYLLLDMIDEFRFTVYSPSYYHPPIIFRLANFKRACFEQMGSRGLAELDKYLSSMHELKDFYIKKSFRLIFKDSTNYHNIFMRVERSFQKSILWAIFHHTHDEMIKYLDNLYCKIDDFLVYGEEGEEISYINKISGDLSYTGTYHPYDESFVEISKYIGDQILPTEEVEKLIKFSLEKRLLSKMQALKIIKNCCDVYKMNKSAREIKII